MGRGEWVSLEFEYYIICGCQGRVPRGFTVVIVQRVRLEYDGMLGGCQERASERFEVGTSQQLRLGPANIHRGCK